MDTLISTSADLAGDRNVVSRAEAVRAAVAAASDEIESTRRLPPALLDKLHEAGLVTAERRGVWTYYRVVPEALAALAAVLTPTGALTPA